MKAMLLAAGLGTRLGTLGQTLPKPLVPVCGYPAILFGLAACARAGLTDIVVNLHHQGQLIEQVLGDGAAMGVRITYSNEIALLGTAGGLAYARTKNLLGDGPVLVMNAKVVADVDLGAVVTAHQASGADATLVLRDDPAARKWGAIAADADERVVSILDERSPRPARGIVAERMFTGIQIIGPRILDRMRPIFSDSVRDGYIPALRGGADIRSVVSPGYFAEHSTPERYLEGNLALLRNPGLIRHPPGILVGIDPAARIHPGAHIVPPVRIQAGALIESGAMVGPEVVVGSGATVATGAQLTRAVVWPGARAEGQVVDTVVASDPAPALLSGRRA